MKMILAAFPDILRLLALPVFAYAAWRDYQTRRVPNILWVPVMVIAAGAFAVDLALLLLDQPSFREPQQFFVGTAISITVMVFFGYISWRSKWLGANDAKAFMLLGILFPVVPYYRVPVWIADLGFPEAIPLLFTGLEVFSFTIMLNTVLIGAVAMPLVMAAWNLAHGTFSPFMLIARPVDIENITEISGTPVRAMTSGEKMAISFRELKCYLEWRNSTVAEFLDNPEQFRRFSFGDNPTIAADGNGHADVTDDPWGAVAFVTETDIAPHTLTPGQLREGLEQLSTIDDDKIWVTPSIPYMVPVLLGVFTSLTAGNLLLVIKVYLL